MTWACALLAVTAVAVFVLPVALLWDAARRPLEVLTEAEEREQFRDMYAHLELEEPEGPSPDADDAPTAWRRTPVGHAASAR